MADVNKSIWIDAPPEVVFEYFTDSEKMARWCGQNAILEPVPGGRYHLDMGVGGLIEGSFLKLEQGKFISLRVHAPEDTGIPSATIEITFLAEADGCRVEVCQKGLSVPFDRMASRGWDHHLARLSVVVHHGQPGTDSFCQRTFDSLAQ